MRIFKWAAIPLGLAIYAAERGLDVSGYENLTVAYGLWLLAGLLALIGASSWVWAWLSGHKKKSGRQPTQSATAQDGSQAFNISAGRDVFTGNISGSQPAPTNEPQPSLEIQIRGVRLIGIDENITLQPYFPEHYGDV